MYKFFNSIYNSIRGAELNETYTIIIHKEDDGYWGECKEIEGCFAQAKTVKELIKLMQENIYFYFEKDNKIDKTSKEEIKLEVSYA